MLSMLIELRAVKNKSNEKLAKISADIRELHEQSNVLNGLRAKNIVDTSFCMREQTEINRKMAQLKKARGQIIGSAENDNALIMTKILLDEFDEEIFEFSETKFKSIVESITVITPTMLKFRLINGLELCEQIERNVRCYKKTESSHLGIK